MSSNPSDSTFVTETSVIGSLTARFAARTHCGRREGRNEDAVGWDAKRALWFIADGMGGHSNGDVASRIVREVLVNETTGTLESSVLKAHEAIIVEAERLGVTNDMGSTVVAVQLEQNRARFVWVGDSRAYLWRKSRLRQVTRDHSFLEALRAQGQLTEDQMRGHPNKNLVTQTLGLGNPNPGTLPLELEQGDRIILCSDGLSDELDDRQIATVMRSKGTPEAAAERLVEAALASGGRDNVTVLVIEPAVEAKASQGLRKSAARAMVAGVFVAISCAVLWWLTR